MSHVGSSLPSDRRAAAQVPAAAPPTGDWAAQAADTIERVVGDVRDKTTGPALTVARGVVYGTFAALVGLAVLVMATIAAVRALNNYLPDAVVGEQHMWAADLLMGLAFVVAGGVLWTRRYGGAEDRRS